MNTLGVVPIPDQMGSLVMSGVTRNLVHVATLPTLDDDRQSVIILIILQGLLISLIEERVLE